jgi:hypothetical protein
MAVATKIIPLVILFIIGLGSAYAVSWAMNENQIGNVATITGDLEEINMSDYDNMTICIPLRPSEGGIVQQIAYRQATLNNPKMSYCLSSSLTHPAIDPCPDGETDISASYGIPLNIDPTSVIKDGTYYFCFTHQTDDGGEITLYTTKTDTESVAVVKDYYDVNTGYDSTKRQYFTEIVSLFEDTENIRVDYMVGGSWNGWQQWNNQLQDIQYCLGSNERCFSVSGRPIDTTINTDRCAVDSFSLINYQSLERFTWNFSDNNLTKLYIMLKKQSSPSNFRYVVKNGSSEIFVSPSISSASLTTNYSIFTYNFPSNIEFRQGDIISVGIKSDGAGGYVCPLIIDYSTDSWYGYGTYGFNGIMRYKSSGSVGDSTADIWFMLEMENDIYSSAVYQCDDGEDNDADGFYDYPDDLGCSGLTDNNEYPYNYYQCNDGLDNDGDGLFDYPQDPSCASTLDNTEAPYDTIYQCDDGNDNDLDGFTDYPLDPSCDSATDNSELPKDGTLYPEDECNSEVGCLIYDTIPYPDSPFFHKWYGIESNTSIAAYLGGYSIDLDTTGAIFEGVEIFKNTTYQNIYQSLQGQISISVIPQTNLQFTDYEPIYIGFFDENEDSVALLLLNLTTMPGDVSYPYNGKLEIYALDGSDYVYVGDAYTKNEDSGFLRFYFTMNEFSERYNISWQDSDGMHKGVNEYDYSDETSLAIVDKVGVKNFVNNDDTQILLNLVELTGYFASVQTICDTWSSPFYLKESFNGYLEDCGWVTSHNIQCLGSLNLQGSISDYQAYRSFSDVIKDDNTRYATIEFDLNMIDITTGDTFTMRLYDDEDYNFLTIWYRDSGEYLWYNDNGAGKQATTITLGDVIPYKLVIDLQADVFDIYVDGSLVKDNAGFASAYYNLENIQYIKITADEVTASLDNLEVYASDSGGIKITPDDSPPITPPDPTLKFCGLMTTEKPSCNSDSDCDTGKCEVSGKCSSFDYTYCDEENYVRGNGCLIKGMANCALSSSGGWILDNFLYFIVLLILLIGISYLIVVWRR